VRAGAVERGLDCLRRHLPGLPVDGRIDFERRQAARVVRDLPRARHAHRAGRHTIKPACWPSSRAERFSAPAEGRFRRAYAG